MNANNLKIKIFCRSFDLRLYRLSKAFYEGMGFPCVRLTDQSADGYFYTMLKDKECDIAINVDEDCFVTNPAAVMELVDFVVKNGYANAGCPDGGLNMRAGNPLVTNPFFNIFDLRLIRTKFSREAVKSFRYADHKEAMIAAFDVDALGGNYTFDRPQVIEPYYQFFLWLAANFKTLYLPSEKHADGVSTLLYDPQGRELCAHSWLSRFYSVPSIVVRLFQRNAGKQKERIDALIRYAAAERGGEVVLPKEHWYNTLQFTADKCVRWLIKVPQRIVAWPAKYRRYHSKN